MPGDSAPEAAKRASTVGSRALLQVLRDFVFTDSNGRSWPLTVAYALVVSAILAQSYPMDLPAAVPVRPDGQAGASLNIALTHLLCRTTSAATPYNVTNEIWSHPELIDQQLRNISVEMAGSFDKYCKQASPFLNNENSLMFLERAILDLSPRLTMHQLGWILFRLKLLLAAVFAVGLLRAGASLLLVTGAGVVVLDILRVLATHFYSMYPFVVPLQAAMLGLYLIAWQSRWPEEPRYAVPAFVAFGALAAFTVNMRTEFQPLIVALMLLFVGLLVVRRRRVWPERARLAALLIGPFAAGYLLFQGVFIWTLPSDTNYNYAHHPVAHPLVLSLGVPRNPLAAREGIEWNDGIGLTLARRVDPSANYLGPGYEEALFTYYFRLWRLYPREMVGIYWAKALLAGAHMFTTCQSGPWSGLVKHSMKALSFFRNGIGLLGFSALVLVSTAVRAPSRHAGLTLPALLIALIATVSLLQSMVIMPEFYPTLQNALLFSMTLLVLLCAQGLIDLAWQGMTQAGSRQRATV